MVRRFHVAAGLTVLLLAAASAALVAFGRPAPLAVVGAVPADGAAGVPTASRVEVTFNRPLDEPSAEAAVTVSPAVDGFTSAAGRRLTFTPRTGFSPDTDYVVTVGPSARDRGGRALAAPHRVRFRTRAPGLVARRADGRLVRLPIRDGRVAGEAEPAGGPAARAFDVFPSGEVVYARLDGRALVATDRAGGEGLTVPLPRGLSVEELRAAPRGRTVLLLGVEDGRPPAPFLVRLDAPVPELVPFGPRPGPLPEALVVETLKRSLNAVVYRHESAAFTPDGRAVVLRDAMYDLAIFGLDGRRHSALGPFLAVGDVSPAGDGVLLVDVDPADGRLRRQVLAFGLDGRTRQLSDPARDSHAPRVSHRGDRVAYATGEADAPVAGRRYAIEVVDLATGERRRLTAPPAGETDLDARWSPDDAWLAVRRAPAGRPGDARVWLVPSVVGPARPLGADLADARWSP